jgi:predicted RND superfamily exporter protein
MKFDTDPTQTRVTIIALLIFIYALTAQSGIMTVLQSRMPEPNEWMYFLLFALGADAVYLLTFLGAETPKETTTSESK